MAVSRYFNPTTEQWEVLTRGYPGPQGDPGPPGEVSLDQLNAKVPITMLSGVGFPEGKVAAPIGSIYTDSAATNGAIRWIKTSGTGNTGWEVEYGDTGLRNITSLMGEVVDDGRIYIQRIGKAVTLILSRIPVPGDGPRTIIPNLIPIGFRTDSKPQNLAIAKIGDDYASGPLVSSWNGAVQIYHSSSETLTSCTVTYVSDTPWPTTLPGTPE